MRRVSNMMKNIYGNDTSPLRGVGVGGRRNPTLRIGLMSVAPAEPVLNNMSKCVLVLILSIMLAACSSRVEYQPLQGVKASADAININTATADELEKLPHIGRKTAETVVRFRTENGPFRRPEYLLQIRGVSEKRFLELRQYLKTE